MYNLYFFTSVSKIVSAFVDTSAHNSDPNTEHWQAKYEYVTF